jgi:hypothetical protein
MMILSLILAKLFSLTTCLVKRLAIKLVRNARCAVPIFAMAFLLEANFLKMDDLKEGRMSKDGQTSIPPIVIHVSPILNDYSTHLNCCVEFAAYC